MNTKKLRITLTYLCGFMYFLGVQLVEAADGQKATLFEGVLVGLVIFGLLSAGFSDWLYGKFENIEYSTYQRIGLGVVVLFISLIIATMYNGLYDGHIGIYSPSFYILFLSIYLFTLLIQKKMFDEDV